MIVRLNKDESVRCQCHTAVHSNAKSRLQIKSCNITYGNKISFGPMCISLILLGTKCAICCLICDRRCYMANTTL